MNNAASTTLLADPERHAVAIVREFLHRRGYTEALASLDAERKKRADEITSRAALVQDLRLQRLVKRNASRTPPLGTMLELIVEALLLKPHGLRVPRAGAAPQSDGRGTERAPPATATRAPAPASAASPPPEASPATRAEPAEEAAEELEALELDVEDLEGVEGGGAAGAVVATLPAAPGAAVDAATVAALHAAIFGSAAADWAPAWRQGFEFSAHASLSYGLVQRRGGCCGVLAAVQALLVRELLRAAPAALAAATAAPPAPLAAAARDEALVGALAAALWPPHATGCVVVAPTPPHAAALPPRRALPGALWARGASSEAGARALLRAALPAWRGAGGVPCLVYSALLSRGLAAAAADMDVPGTALLGAHHYCTQELVNLLLLGRAASNVFDGDKTLGGGAGEGGVGVRLRGVAAADAPARVGLLSHAEAHGHGEVGPTLKRPASPVWLACIESHYTACFAPAGALPADAAAPFDLVYFDQLGGQDEQIRLSLCPRPPRGAPRPEHAYGLVPPLEETLQTRWPGATIDWNGSEPLL